MKTDNRLLVLALLAIAILLPLQLSLYRVFDLMIVVIGYGIIYLLYKFSHLTTDEMGLGKGSLKRGLLPGLAIAGVIFAAVGIAFLISPEAFEDNRYNQPFVEMAVSVFLLLPLQTVILEELLFRGLLLGSVNKKISFRNSAIVTSILFGLWHVLASRNMTSAITPEILEPYEKPLLMTTVVLVTTGAGFILCYLRKRYDSLLVPMAAHWAINGSAILFAYLAFR